MLARQQLDVRNRLLFTVPASLPRGLQWGPEQTPRPGSTALRFQSIEFRTGTMDHRRSRRQLGRH